jgi:hypothetical protein
VDDLNILGHTKDIDEPLNHVKTKFEKMDLDRTKFFLGLQLEHLQTCMFVHQSTYVQKALEKFNMDKVYQAKTPMIVHALEMDTDRFRPKEE